MLERGEKAIIHIEMSGNIERPMMNARVRANGNEFFCMIAALLKETEANDGDLSADRMLEVIKMYADDIGEMKIVRIDNS